MEKNKVSEVLIKLRKQHGFTQNDLAEQLGVSFQAVSKWERGENLPDAYTLVDIARIYNITVDEILKGKVLEKDDELDRKLMKRKNTIIIIAIGMIIVAPVSIFFVGVDNYTFYVPIILIITAISVGLMIYGSNTTKQYGSLTVKTREEKRVEEIVYTICAGIFLLLGLVWNLFNIAWIIFIFGYALILIINKK